MDIVIDPRGCSSLESEEVRWDAKAAAGCGESSVSAEAIGAFVEIHRPKLN